MSTMTEDYRVTDGYLETEKRFSLSESLAAWRREARTDVVDLGRYRCKYFEWGQGQPLVFVHGMSDQSRCFVPVIAHLTCHFRCIAYELPNGAGDGAKLGHIRHRDLVDDLFELFDHFRFGQVCIYGGSFGSTIALSALARQPRRFLRAAFHGAFARRRLAPAERCLARLAAHWPGPMARLPFRAMVQQKADAPAFAAAEPDVWEFQRANTRCAPIRSIAHRALLIDTMDLRPTLPRVTHPVLLITGDRDTVVRQSALKELMDGLPHADHLEFSQCGHYPQYTHSAGVAEALRRFLLPPCGLSG
jgi:pimeloyl-ACP methyl ester carboxylesterase